MATAVPTSVRAVIDRDEHDNYELEFRRLKQLIEIGLLKIQFHRSLKTCDVERLREALDEDYHHIAELLATRPVRRRPVRDEKHRDRI